MLSLTTHLAAKYPDLVDGDYETRVEILNNLTKKSGEILERKSWRLARMTPEKIELWRINSEKERKQLMIEMNPIADEKAVRPTGLLSEQEESTWKNWFNNNVFFISPKIYYVLIVRYFGQLFNPFNPFW